MLPGRSSKQCWERWKFTLDPTITKKRFSLAEDKALIQLFRKYGAKWAKIAKMLPNSRTSNNVKNRYHGALKNRLSQISETVVSYSNICRSKAKDVDVTHKMITRS